MSHPSRVCGLKFVEAKTFVEAKVVTPLAGVWIEIMTRWLMGRLVTVTPLAGVWIEIH